MRFFDLVKFSLQPGVIFMVRFQVPLCVEAVWTVTKKVWIGLHAIADNVWSCLHTTAKELMLLLEVFLIGFKLIEVDLLFERAQRRPHSPHSAADHRSFRR